MTASHQPLKLAELRTRKRLSQAKAAEWCGLGTGGRDTLRDWELGKRQPQVRHRAAVMRYLWSGLGLEQDEDAFRETWRELVDRWGWEQVADAELRALRLGADESGASADEPLPFSIPSPVDGFFGRVAEEAEVVGHLASDGTRAPAVVI